jgi:hypothetical protein
VSQQKRGGSLPGIIAYCGLDCSECSAFIATQTNDLEQKRKIAERWTKELKIEFRPENIECMGCKSDRVSGWCTKICRVRPCAEARVVRTCADCEDYLCGKLKEFLSNEPKAATNLEQIKKAQL